MGGHVCQFRKCSSMKVLDLYDYRKSLIIYLCKMCPGRPPQVSTAQLGRSTDFSSFLLFWAAELHRRNNINIILDADNYNCVRFRRSEGRNI